MGMKPASNLSSKLSRLVSLTSLLLCFAALIIASGAADTAIAFGPMASHGSAPSPTTKPKPPVNIMVTKIDGAVLRGTLTSTDGHGLVMNVVGGKASTHPSTQPTAASASVPTGPATLRWTEIKTVSNGLTRAKAIDAFRLEHAGQLCATCRGAELVRCDLCKGTGRDPAGRKDCATCNGELLVDCKAPKCTAGKIPCPAPCLKLTEGTWFMKEGRHWRKFPGKGGASAEISENHLGQLLNKDPATGQVTPGDTCPTCGGATKLDCPVCMGTAKQSCPTCVADAAAAACTAECDHGLVDCKDCVGTGLKK